MLRIGRSETAKLVASPVRPSLVPRRNSGSQVALTFLALIAQLVVPARVLHATDMFSLYPQFEYSLAAIQLILSMIGMGATLTRTEFQAILRRPQTIAGVMVVQYVVLPAI